MNTHIEFQEVYTANGNILGVVKLHDGFAKTDYRNDNALSDWLVNWGRKNSVDSIMVLSKSSAAAIAADVFEPWSPTSGSSAGTWSTMCGNGMMAAACFYEEYVAEIDIESGLSIETRSGIRNVKKLSQNQYRVCMGSFTFGSKDLSPYVQIPDAPLRYLDIPAPVTVDFSSNCSIGLSGTRLNGVIDGEPHIVLISEAPMDKKALHDAAIAQGPLITKNFQIFPNEINANFAVLKQLGSFEHGAQVTACTHERGLGSDPVKSVTGACGTGATAIGSVLYALHGLPDEYPVHISMPGGTLLVYRYQNEFYLSGRAVRYK